MVNLVNLFTPCAHMLCGDVVDVDVDGGAWGPPTQVRARAEVVARSVTEKLNRLPGGDFEESDEELQEFAANFEQVGAGGEGGLGVMAHCVSPAAEHVTSVTRAKHNPLLPTRCSTSAGLQCMC